MKNIFTILLVFNALFITKAQQFFELKTFIENGKYGLLDEKGNKVTAAKYDAFTATFYEGLCSLAIDGNIGYINEKGKEIIPFQYENVGEFTADGFAAVKKNGKWGFINKKGKEIIPLIYQKVFDFSKGKAFVIDENTAHFINTKGEDQDQRYSLDGKYAENNLNIIKNNFGQFGFLHDQTILPNFYDQLTFYTDADFAMVTNNKKIGFIKLNGDEIVPPIYDEFSGADDQYFYLWKNNKKGIIDFTGKIISPFIYGSISPFSEGLASVKLDVVFVPNERVKTDEHYGFIDETGKEVIPRTFDFAWEFKEGKAKVRLGEEEFYINKKGDRID